MDLNKHIVEPTNNQNTYHSNGYAVIAHGDRIGSTSATPFSQRLQIDRNRQIVDVYHRSTIGRTYGALKARSVARDRVDIAKLNTDRIAPPSSVRQPGRFNEPSSRNYNPYS